MTPAGFKQSVVSPATRPQTRQPGYQYHANSPVPGPFASPTSPPAGSGPGTGEHVATTDPPPPRGAQTARETKNISARPHTVGAPKQTLGGISAAGSGAGKGQSARGGGHAAGGPGPGPGGDKSDKSELGGGGEREPPLQSAARGAGAHHVPEASKHVPPAFGDYGSVSNRDANSTISQASTASTPGTTASARGTGGSSTTAAPAGGPRSCWDSAGSSKLDSRQLVAEAVRVLNSLPDVQFRVIPAPTPTPAASSGIGADGGGESEWIDCWVPGRGTGASAGGLRCEVRVVADESNAARGRGVERAPVLTLILLLLLFFFLDESNYQPCIFSLFVCLFVFDIILSFTSGPVFTSVACGGKCRNVQAAVQRSAAAPQTLTFEAYLLVSYHLIDFYSVFSRLSLTRFLNRINISF
jgi:hypothetical protein